MFGFAEFLAALALLVLVFNSTDYLYRFRIAIAPIPLFKLTFVATVVIGVGTLLTDLWFAERWYAPSWNVSRAAIQAGFGFLFLLTALLWMWFAFVAPPAFSKWNYKRFYNALVHVVVRGSDAQLPIVATELPSSFRSLLRLSGQAPTTAARRTRRKPSVEPEVARYAHWSLQVLGNRKLCRHIVASSPITAIQLMQEASKQKRYDAPLGEFARNVTAEAILNRDSILYHEDDLQASDFVGLAQPFSKAMYGDFLLVEGSGSGRFSAFDIDWRMASTMDGHQFEAYCRAVLITFKSYIDSGRYHAHSYTLYRASETIKGAGGQIYKLDGLPTSTESKDVTERLSAAVRFVDDVIKFLGEKQGIEFGQLRIGEQGAAYHQETVFDHIAELMFEVIHDAAYVRSPPEQAWLVHYNIVWGRLFSLRNESPAWRVIRFKLARLIFDEIKRMEEFPNFKGARVLGLCLNVMGLRRPEPGGHDRNYYPLEKAVLNWTRKHYLHLVEANPRVAEYCLSGGISFDAENKRLVKMYAANLSGEPARDFLDLADHRPIEPRQP